MPLLLIGGILGFGVLAWTWSAPARARRAAEAELEAKARMSAAELAGWALGVVRWEKWQRFATAKTLESRLSGSITDHELRDLLGALFAEVTAEDEAQRRRGRDSNFFEWHDAGLASVVEILDRRCHE